MKNFNFHAYTDIFFGEGEIVKLADKVAEYGNNVLLVYGGGSIKKNGIYDAVINNLQGFNITELSGVEPNPKIESVRRGVELCRQNNVDVILAVGGGSTIDCAKVVAGAVNYDGDAWDIVTDPKKIDKVLPVITVLTLAATGSEMNKNAVISNMSENKKLGTASMKFIPQASILDPTYTYGVSKLQTASGTADIMSHVFENYFKSEPDTFLQDRIAEGIIETCINYLPIALDNPSDYSARANLMWASTLALNGLVGSGKGQSFSCHPMEHELSAFYDITHGVGLAILTPRWMRYILSDKTIDKFVDFAVNVWHIDLADMSGETEEERKYAAANEAINRLEQFFKESGLPMTLTEVSIDDKNIRQMAEAAVKHGKLINAYIPLTPDDVEKIYRACL